MASVSVILCTHNPRQDYLIRTLEALRAQALPAAQWQLLVVDNLSDEPLAKSLDLSWHPDARMVREETPGLTAARLRGIRESQGELLVFVDDDNVLASDYLATSVKLFATRTDLGAASGCLLPEYETPPPAWFDAKCESWIAVRRLEKSFWSNFLDSRSEPAGAGLCLRSSIAEIYARETAKNPAQMLLGRRGQSLLSGEDVVIAKTALRAGYTIGQFVELKLTHLIPSRRVQPEYLFSLYRHLVATGAILGWLDDPSGECARISFQGRLREIYRFLFRGSLERRFVLERIEARRLARELVASVKTSEP